MKKFLSLICCGLFFAAAIAQASLNVTDDDSGEVALVTWKNPALWQAGLSYLRISRPVEMDGIERDLKATVIEAMVGVSPWPWLLLYGNVGATEAQLEPVMTAAGSTAAGGLLGARLNAWQINQGPQNTSWRLTLQFAAQHAFRTSSDDGEGDLTWNETLFYIPLDYHLSYARTFRNAYAGEFQSFHFYAGPAFSLLNGQWKRDGFKRDFEGSQAFGVVGGGELWLLENLALGVRVDWFEGTSGQLSVRYRF